MKTKVKPPEQSGRRNEHVRRRFLWGVLAVVNTRHQSGEAAGTQRKVRTFEAEEYEVRRAKCQLLIASGLTGIAALLMGSVWLGSQQPWLKWQMMGLALVMVLGPGWNLVKKVTHLLRRGIFNRHVLLAFGAFAGLIGGFAGFFAPDFPIADLFAVTMFVTTCHILLEYTLLKVRTRGPKRGNGHCH